LKLIDLQSKFSQHLLHQNVDLTELDATGPFPVEALMGLYRNNFYISLSECLAAYFPAVLALVGEEFFAQLAKAYIKQSALDKAELDNFGAGFSGFIAGCEQTKSLAYLGDVAALDWAFDGANAVASIAAFPYDRLSQLEEPQQSQIIFQLAPNTLLIKAGYPLLKIWLGAKSGDLDGVDMAQSDYVILYPEGEQGAKYTSLSAEQYQFLLAVKEQKGLEQLAESADFSTHLKEFISQNIINNFKLEGEV